MLTHAMSLVSYECLVALPTLQILLFYYLQIRLDRHILVADCLIR